MPDRPHLRLWADSESSVFGRPAPDQSGPQDWKNQIASGPLLPFRDRPAELRNIYLLGPGESRRTAIEPIKPAMALAELIKHAFILDAQDRRALQSNFDRLAGVADTIACFTLDYPRSYAALPDVRDAILAHASSGANAR